MNGSHMTNKYFVDPKTFQSRFQQIRNEKSLELNDFVLMRDQQYKCNVICQEAFFPLSLSNADIEVIVQKYAFFNECGFLAQFVCFSPSQHIHNGREEGFHFIYETSGNNLQQLILSSSKNRLEISQNFLWKLLECLVGAVNRLEAMGQAYKTLKPSNVLLFGEGGIGQQMKVFYSNFSISNMEQIVQQQQSHQNYVLSPEQIEAAAQNWGFNKFDSFQSICFSIAQLVVVVATARFDGLLYRNRKFTLDPDQLKYSLDKISDVYSKSFALLIRSMVAFSPSSRPSLSDVKEYIGNFVKQNNDEKRQSNIVSSGDNRNSKENEVPKSPSNNNLSTLTPVTHKEERSLLQNQPQQFKEEEVFKNIDNLRKVSLNVNFTPKIGEGSPQMNGRSNSKLPHDTQSSNRSCSNERYTQSGEKNQPISFLSVSSSSSRQKSKSKDKKKSNVNIQQYLNLSQNQTNFNGRGSPLAQGTVFSAEPPFLINNGYKVVPYQKKGDHDAKLNSSLNSMSLSSANKSQRSQEKRNISSTSLNLSQKQLNEWSKSFLKDESKKLNPQTTTNSSQVNRKLDFEGLSNKKRSQENQSFELKNRNKRSSSPNGKENLETAKRSPTQRTSSHPILPLFLNFEKIKKQQKQSFTSGTQAEQPKPHNFQQFYSVVNQGLDKIVHPQRQRHHQARENPIQNGRLFSYSPDRSQSERQYKLEEHHEEQYEKQVPNQYNQFVEEIQKKMVKDEIGNIRENMQIIHYEDGSKYIGETEGKKRHGKGIYYYISGEVYAGEWLINRLHGKGIYIFKNGEKYEGELKDGLKDGYGIYFYHNMNHYQGFWRADLQHGEGAYYYHNKQEFYQGTYCDGYRDGLGTYNFSNGDKFIGNWQAGKQHGRGFVYFKDGSSFEGEWRNNMPHGSGLLQYANGDLYQGNYICGIKEGFGIYIYNTVNASYKGTWETDEPSGYGLFHYSNGDVYQGEILSGRRCGQGKYIYSNGDYYLGDWINDKKQGMGSMNFFDGTVYLGQWRCNMMDGLGQIVYRTGDTYEGDWYEDKQCGKGTYNWVSGGIYQGEWRNDKMNGHGFFINSTGEVHEGIWVENSIVSVKN